MLQFLGTHTVKLDKKGRVSVPAPFRAVLERTGSEDIVLRPHHKFPSIEALPLPAFERLAASVSQLDAYSDQAEDLAAAIFAEATQLRPDAEGRVVLPEELVQHAGLTDSVAFVGFGGTFQIWEPAAAKRRTEEAKQRARERGMTVPLATAPNPNPRGVA